jgi:opacity protein-like surface antigen
MKKQYLAGIIASVLSFGTLAAQAQYYQWPENMGPFFRVDIGPSFFQNGRLTEFGGPVSSRVSYDTGLATDAAFGWAFNQYLATDFEVGFVGATINNVPGYYSSNSRIYNIPFTANIMFTWPIPNSRVVPYVGAGIGGADVVFDTDEFSDGYTSVYGNEDDVVFTGQIFAGLRFNFNPNMSLDVGYKYLATGAPTFSYPPAPNFQVGFDGVRTHSILVAFEWNF